MFVFLHNGRLFRNVILRMIAFSLLFHRYYFYLLSEYLRSVFQSLTGQATKPFLLMFLTLAPFSSCMIRDVLPPGRATNPPSGCMPIHTICFVMILLLTLLFNLLFIGFIFVFLKFHSPLISFLSSWYHPNKKPAMVIAGNPIFFILPIVYFIFFRCWNKDTDKCLIV